MNDNIIKKKILIVDDSPFFIATLGDALQENFDVVKAQSGEEAIEILEVVDQNPMPGAKSFDLVITDLNMPGLTGFDVAEYVKGKNRTQKFTPVIMLTGNNITKEEARKHGCAAYIPKNNLEKVISMARILLKE